MLQNFLLNLLLTAVWVALTGKINYVNFIFGFVLAYLLLWFINKNNPKTTSYFNRVPKIIIFILKFLLDIIKANIQVTIDVLTPNYNMKPGIIKYELDAKTDFEITMLTNIISLTPGTLVLDISRNKKFMYIHAMYLSDIEKFKNDLKKNTEIKLLEILR